MVCDHLNPASNRSCRFCIARMSSLQRHIWDTNHRYLLLQQEIMTNTLSLGSHLSWWHTAYGNLMQTNETQLRMLSDLQINHQEYMEKLQSDESEIKQLKFSLENLQWQQRALEEKIVLLNKIKQDLENNLQDMNHQLKSEKATNQQVIADLDRKLSLLPTLENEIQIIQGEANRERMANQKHVSDLEDKLAQMPDQNSEKKQLHEKLRKLSEEHCVQMSEFQQNSEACSGHVKSLQSKISTLESTLHKTKSELSSTKKRYSDQEDVLLQVSKDVEKRVADQVEQAEKEWKDEFEHSQRYISDLNKLREEEKNAYEQRIDLITHTWEERFNSETIRLKQLLDERKSNYKTTLSRNVETIQEMERKISENEKILELKARN